MSTAGIQNPYEIGALPVPFDNTHGHTYLAPVYGIRGSRKRKRHEVAVGIDGEGVRVYHCQSQNLVTSYAIPSHNYLCCPPLSLHLRNGSPSRTQRRTYVVLKEGTNHSQKRIVCFCEDDMGKSNTDGQTPTSVRKEHELPHDKDIVGLDLACSHRVEEYKFLIVITFKNGDALSLDADLNDPHQHPNLDAKNVVDYEVEYAGILDSDTAKKGVLKGREDVIALLDPAPLSVTATGPSLLYQLVRTSQTRTLQLYSLQIAFPDSLQSTKAGMKLLTSYNLSSCHDRRSTAVQYDLHATSGAIYQLLNGKLTIYDLSGTIPQISTELGTGHAPVTSFARISSSSVLTVSNDIATVSETTYGSVQASIPLNKSVTSMPPTKKRKREEGKDSPSSLRFLPAFTDLGLVIGHSESKLIAIPLEESLRGNKGSRHRGTLLTEAMGKGSLKAAYKPKKNTSNVKNWEQWKLTVDKLVDDMDMGGLENLVANGHEPGKQRTSELPEPDTLLNGTASDEDSWPERAMYDPHRINRRKALYILKKAFCHDGRDEGKLEVRIKSAKILQWLACAGFLSTAYLHRILPDVLVRSGDIMAAVATMDDSFQTMHSLISLPLHWDVAEVVQALRILVQSFMSASETEMPLTLPAPLQPNGQSNSVSGDPDSQLDPELDVAERELDKAMAVYGSGLEVRSETFRSTLARLQAYPHELVSMTMRTMLTNSEQVFFIHLLRIELADGGWTSRYVDEGEDEFQDGIMNMGDVAEENAPSDQAIKVIGDLLHCALDAIGTSGWLVGLGGDALGTEELVESLRAEISAGIEGCYEASTLGTFLMDLENFAAQLKHAQSKPQGRKRDGKKDGEGKALLPLGCRVAPAVIKGRNESGEQSRAIMAREKRNGVGKYSIDKIRI